MSDPYVYLGTAVLRNKENIRDRHDLFCLARHVDRELAKRFEAIQAESCLRGLSIQEFAARAADHVCELNAIHAFREGNGRTLRAFLFVLGRQAGHEVDLGRIDPRTWIEASRESFRTGDSKPMRDVIAVAVGSR
jgi:cell filamentation protein